LPSRSAGGEPGSLLKRGEPHGRLQGATNLQGIEQSKPSEPGGTARTERARRLATPGRRRRRVRSCPSGWVEPPGRRAPRGWQARTVAGSGCSMLTSTEGRSLENPKRGVQAGRSSRRVPQTGLAPKAEGASEEDGHGPCELDCVFEGEVKVRRAVLLVDPTPRRNRSGRPSQASAKVHTTAQRPRRASEKGQRLATRADVRDTALRLVPQWRRRGRPCRPRQLREAATPCGVQQPARHVNL
jgi:hypothetical protein